MHTVCSDESLKHDLEKLSELYWPRLKKYFHGQGFSEDDAEDLTQETLKEISRCIADFDSSKGPLDNYVFTQAYWQATDHWGKQGSRSSKFAPGDILEPDILAAKITARRDPVSDFLAGQFSEKSRRSLSAPVEPYTFQKILAAKLNIVLLGPVIYEPARFAGVLLSKRMVRSISDQPIGEDLMWLNRWLLEAAYPDELRERHRRERWQIESLDDDEGADEIPDPASSPAEAAEVEDDLLLRNERFERALRKLEKVMIGKNPAVSAATVLRLYLRYKTGGMTRKQAAAELGLKVNTFSQYVTRDAMKKLQEILGDDCEDPSI